MKRSISILVICALALNGAAVRAEETVRYAAVETVESSRELSGSFVSTGTGESAICVTSGTLLLRDASIVRSCDAAADDAAVQSGAGAAVLAAGGRVNIRSSAIDADAPGAAGLFAAAEGEIVAAEVAVDTGRDGSAGIAASGGVLRAENLRVTTGGNASPAIRLDSGGSASVEGGSYQTSGADSPAADASAEGRLRDAELTAGASEALCVHSGGNLLLQNCRVLGGAMTEERGGIAAALLCADGEDGARLEMAGGELSARSGRLFCMEGGAGEILLCGVELDAEAEILLECIGAPGRATGAAIGRFTAIGQAMGGDVCWNTGFGLEFYLSEGSSLSGAVYAGEDAAGGGYCSLYIDASSHWTVTADSMLTNLSCAGEIVDADGRSVTIVGTDGTVYVQGDGERSVTVERYSAECDMSGAGRRADGEV